MVKACKRLESGTLSPSLLSHRLGVSGVFAGYAASAARIGQLDPSSLCQMLLQIRLYLGGNVSDNHILCSGN